MKRILAFLAILALAPLLLSHSNSGSTTPAIVAAPAETPEPIFNVRKRVVLPTIKASPTAVEPPRASLEDRVTTLVQGETQETLTPEQLHHRPPGLANTAKILGDVMDTLQADPSRIPEGIRFYEKCATSEAVLDSTRAVCLRNWKYWSAKSGEPAPSDTSVPEGIARLARELPAIR